VFPELGNNYILDLETLEIKKHQIVCEHKPRRSLRFQNSPKKKLKTRSRFRARKKNPALEVVAIKYDKEINPFDKISLNNF
jgi:hypothetical protein